MVLQISGNFGFWQRCKVIFYMGLAAVCLGPTMVAAAAAGAAEQDAVVTAGIELRTLQPRVKAGLTDLFADGLNGAMAVVYLNGAATTDGKGLQERAELWVSSVEKASRRHSPASTFKVPHALMAFS